MSDSINCNFARCAVRQSMSAHMKGKLLPKGKMPEVVRAYNHNFESTQDFQVTYGIAVKRFQTITRLFIGKWHPNEMKGAYLSVFSVDAWKTLSQDEREKHTLKQCKACKEQFPSLSNAFPTPVRRKKKTLSVTKTPVTIELTERDLSTPRTLGRKVLKELENISQEHFQKSGADVITMTPKSHLVHRPSSEEQRRSKRKVEKQIKGDIETEKEKQASDIVLQNRLSWNAYDKLRKAEGLTTTPKRPAQSSAVGSPRRKKRYGDLSQSLQIEKEKLLEEAQAWRPDERMNWSELARRYGITSPNGGQIVKEFLQENNIPAASIQQRASRAQRRCKKRVGSTHVTVPMFPTILHEKEKIQQKISSGEIELGSDVVPSSYHYYSVNSETHALQTNRVDFCGKKISLHQIRKKLLQKHEELGLIRDHSDDYFASFSEVELKIHLDKLKIPYTNSENIRNKLKEVCRTRHLKIWHDHSSIAAHGYLLVLISIIYDPAFYYTTEEMKSLKGVNIDVPAMIEKPEIHILARSSSSTEDQLLFVETRRECLKKMRETIKSAAEVEIHDIVRFFYGDGPAAQFEAGHKQGGTYCCIGCGAESGRFLDIAYSYRAPKHSLLERQEFVLQGRAWRKGGINPLDNLRIEELRTELERRGLPTATKRKPQLERDYNQLRRGITNVPALLQGVPEMPLTELCLESYEISPVEPLHDVKGHLSNIIEEVRVRLTGKVRKEVDVIHSSVLGKETLRGSDYRKGAILILKSLHDNMPASPLTTLLSTAVEITELLYCDPTKRTTQSVLRLHNVSFVHGKLCADLFSNPKTVSSRKMFGRYFHALTTHAPLLNRIIAPRLLNTELEERMFGQCKAITRNTSNQHTNHIITNILVRLSFEAQSPSSGADTIHKQESEVLKLAQALPPKQNTIIPLAWLQACSVHYQAHLERISDYLLQGPGTWWQYVNDGVEFFDAHMPNPPLLHPPIHHFRSTTMADVDMYLLENWEKCLDEEVPLPAHYIRTYDNAGVCANNIRSYQHDMQTQIHPSTECLSPDPGLQTQTHSSSSPDPGLQTQTHSSSSPDPGLQTQSHSSTECSSQDPGLQTQTHPSTECSSCATTSKQSRAHKPRPYSSVTKSLLAVLPTDMHDGIMMFDQLRYKTKTAKTCRKTPTNLLKQYYAASATLKDKLLEHLQTTCQYTESPAYNKELQHQANVIKRILAHEWNIEQN